MASRDEQTQPASSNTNESVEVQLMKQRVASGQQQSACDADVKVNPWEKLSHTSDILSAQPGTPSDKLQKNSTSGDGNQMPSIHDEQAARRGAVSELIFFAGTNDLRRCQKLVTQWNIKVM
eukprot:gene18141-24581_t